MYQAAGCSTAETDAHAPRCSGNWRQTRVSEAEPKEAKLKAQKKADPKVRPIALLEGVDCVLKRGQDRFGIFVSLCLILFY